MADEAPKDAALIDQQDINWNADTAKAEIKKFYQEARVIHHERSRRTYEGKTQRLKIEEALQKKERRELIRFSTGHSTLLNGYKHRIGIAKDDKCRRCKEEAETTFHVINDCPVMEKIRHDLEIKGPNVLTDRPDVTLRFMRAFGLFDTPEGASEAAAVHSPIPRV